MPSSQVTGPQAPAHWPSKPAGRPELPPILLDEWDDTGENAHADSKGSVAEAASSVSGSGRLPPMAAEAGEYRFGMVCPVCATRMDFVSSQIGQRTSCPDCFTSFDIVTPGPNVERMLLSEDGFGAPDRLSLEAARDDGRRLDSPDAVKQRADQLLQRAAEEMKAERREARETVLSDAATRSLFHFLVVPSTIARMIAIAVLGSVALGFLTLATRSEADGSYGFRSLLSLMVGVPLAVLWSAVLSAHLLTLLRETSVAVGDIEDWPGPNLFEWIGSGFQLGWALVLSAVPGLVLAFFLGMLGLGGWIVGLVTPLSIIAIFPILFLSMLHEQSWVSVFSMEVWQGISRASHIATTFYQASALLGILAWMALGLIWVGQPLLAIPQSVGLVGLSFLYFRLLGWLAHSMAQEDDEQVVA